MRLLNLDVSLAPLVSSSTLLAVAGMVVASSAFSMNGTMAAFTRQTSNAGNTFTAATVNLTAVPRQTAGGSDNAAGSDIFSGTQTTTTVTLDKVIPGDSFTRFLTLNNTGDVAADFTLTAAAANPGADAGITALTDGGAKSLRLKISECTDATFASCTTDVYASGGAATAPTVSNHAVKANVAASAKVYLRLVLELPAAVADDGTGTSVQGKSAAFTYTWRATQNGAGAAR